MLIIQHNNRSYQLERYPFKGNPTWLPWTTAEQYALHYVEEQWAQAKGLAVYHDRFGVLGTLLAKREPRVVLTHASQREALTQQLSHNQVAPVPIQSLLQAWEQPVPYAVLQLPKSWDLLEHYLAHLSAALPPNAQVVLGFMTKYFRPKLLDIAQQYFEQVTQSRAWKKARLLLLSRPTGYQPPSLWHQLPFQGKVWKQPYGVFSAQHIDYASQFLLAQVPAPAPETQGLDIACGNGILGGSLHARTPSCTVTYMDDFEAAIQAARCNAPYPEQSVYHWNYHLKVLPVGQYDWAVCNPPFHQEHDITTDVAHHLFEQAAACLRSGGKLWLVANQHLKYSGVLKKHFEVVERLAQNQKFIVYQCVKH